MMKRDAPTKHQYHEYVNLSSNYPSLLPFHQSTIRFRHIQNFHADASPKILSNDTISWVELALPQVASSGRSEE